MLSSLAAEGGVGKSAELECLRVASRQHGVISRRQARDLGMSDRRITHRLASGRWEPLFPAVYRVEGSVRTWHQELRAALTWAGRRAAISHGAAAALLGFARFKPGAIELSAPGRHESRRLAVVHRVSALPPRELTWVDGLTVTAATRTLVDLAATEEPPTLRASVDEALRRKWTTLDKLEAALARSSYQRGVAALREMVDRLLGGEAPAESELEARVAEVLETAGFPRPIRQHVIRTRRGVRRMDFLIPGTRVVIEADGYAYHSSFDTFEDQRARHLDVTAKGLVVVPWTWRALDERPEELVEKLRQTLAAFQCPA